MTRLPTPGADARSSRIGRVLRAIFRALLFAFVFGFAIGTLIRCSAEGSRSPRLQYLGERASADGSARSA